MVLYINILVTSFSPKKVMKKSKFGEFFVDKSSWYFNIYSILMYMLVFLGLFRLKACVKEMGVLWSNAELIHYD